MKILIIIIKILFVGALLIASNNNLYLNNSQDLGSFVAMYGSWVQSLVNQGISVTSYVVKFKWMPSTDNINNQTILINSTEKG